MKNNEVIRIAIAETSVIIRGGLTAALKRLPNAKEDCGIETSS